MRLVITRTQGSSANNASWLEVTCKHATVCGIVRTEMVSLWVTIEQAHLENSVHRQRAPMRNVRAAKTQSFSGMCAPEPLWCRAGSSGMGSLWRTSHAYSCSLLMRACSNGDASVA